MISMEVIGRIFPRKLVRAVASYLSMGGISMEAERVLGSMIFYSIVFSVILFIITALSTDMIVSMSGVFAMLGEMLSYIFGAILLFLLILLGVLIAVSILIYAYLLVKIDARRRELELVLPDFLQLAAANVRAGLPIEQALWRAATPEFGILSKEVQNAMKRTFSGESIQNSLTYLAGRFNSRYLTRTASVLKFGIESGGEIGEILERTATDLRKMQIMYKEASASMLMYVILIGFAALVGAPLLFAISYKLISTLASIWVNIPQTQDFSSFGLISLSPPQISASDFKLFSVLAVTATSIFASFILAVIRSGSTKEGIKYLPFFLIAGLAMLIIFMSLVDSLLSSLFI